MTVVVLTPAQAVQAKTAAKAAFLTRLADAETAAWRRVDDSELQARLQASLIDRARVQADRWWGS